LPAIAKGFLFHWLSKFISKKITDGSVSKLKASRTKIEMLLTGIEVRSQTYEKPSKPWIYFERKPISTFDIY
jgi:hypothetical protein